MCSHKWVSKEFSENPHPKHYKAKSLHTSFISTLTISQLCLQNMKGRYSGCVPCSEFDLNLFVSQSLNLPTHQRQISHHSYLSAATMWSTTAHTAAQLFSVFPFLTVSHQSIRKCHHALTFFFNPEHFMSFYFPKVKFQCSDCHIKKKQHEEKYCFKSCSLKILRDCCFQKW